MGTDSRIARSRAVIFGMDGREDQLPILDLFRVTKTMTKSINSLNDPIQIFIGNKKSFDG